jgi:tRNA-specific adenosine deaminase 2
MSQQDANILLEKALELAQEAFEVGEVPIGCVISSRHDPLKILATGRNRTNEQQSGIHHAEFEALQALSPEFSASFGNLIVAVTIEPCIMCASLLRSLGIFKVFYGARNERFGGCGSVFSAHTFPSPHPNLTVIQVPEMIARNINLLRKFYLRENGRAPPEKKKIKSNRVFKEYSTE